MQRISRGLRDIALWGAAHLVYSLGAAMLDGTSEELARSGAYGTAGIGGLLACSGVIISLGVGSSPQPHTTFPDLTRIADEAVYEAKRKGLKRVDLRLLQA